MRKHYDMFTVGKVVIRYLLENRMMHYVELADILGIAQPTAYNYLRAVAQKYKDKIRFQRGTAILVKDFEEDELPVEVKYEAQKKTIQTLQKQMKEKKEIAKKLEENHLSHMEKALLEKRYDEVERQIKEIKKKLDELMK